MMKIMLIDDDVPMLEYVGRLLDESNLGLVLVASASASEQALELFKLTEPDIVVTDIGMPGMDGLELAEAFRVINPEVRLLFLTCYEDFQYSKRAFQLDADDYIIKDELSARQLATSLDKAIRRISSRRELLDRYTLQQDMMRHKEALKQSFLKQLLAGSSEKELLLFGERLGISWKLPYFQHAVLHIDAASALDRYRQQDLPLIHFAVANIASELSAGTGMTALPSGQSDIYIISNVDKAVGLDDSLQTYLTRVGEKAHQYLKVELSGVYSGNAYPFHQIGASYHSLMSRCDSGFYVSGAFALVPETPICFRQPSEGRGDKERSLLSLGFSEGNMSLFDLAVNGLTQQAATEQLNPRAVKERLADLVRQSAYETNTEVEDGFYALIGHAFTSDEAARLAKRELRNLLGQQFNGFQAGSEKDIRLQAIDLYLEEHADRMVTSFDMAAHLHLNASYFSRFFKRLAGVNFTDYVNQYKINLAIAMLKKEHETVENVAYTIGFSDRAYFSKVFKKYSGKSPSEYKGQ
ncbi:response regulator transcription factor [Paenibacillus sinopodophylli]|uniref:response regulator transcription factor n=1 Tax=Paenibacillus sinopodophylli TaxID=1837342 RepID=UPI00110CB5CE|nr:response regulator [Paenibacillus sinopodophylli]